jgi:hypothetical protein
VLSVVEALGLSSTTTTRLIIKNNLKKSLIRLYQALTYLRREVSHNLPQFRTLTVDYLAAITVAIMTPPKSDLELAKAGSPDAIAALINFQLKSQGITAKATLKRGHLQIFLEAPQIPNQQRVVSSIKRRMRELNAASIRKVTVLGKAKDDLIAAWCEEFVSEYIPIASAKVFTEQQTALFAENQHFAFIQTLKDQPQGKLLDYSVQEISTLEIFSNLKKGWSWYVSGFSRPFYQPIYLSPTLWRIVLTVLVSYPYLQFGVKSPKLADWSNEFLSKTQHFVSTRLLNSASIRPPEDIPPPSTLNSEPFLAAVRKANRASVAIQSARSLTEWHLVYDDWQAATNLMKAVPTYHPKYAIAQQKIEEYSKYLSYAQTNFERQRQQSLLQGEQIFKQFRGIYKIMGLLTDQPVVWLILPEADWLSLSKSQQISLTVLADDLMTQVRSNPKRYVGMVLSSEDYEASVQKVANLCDDCWEIVLSKTKELPYTMDRIVVQGDTPWQREDECCKAINASEFRGF